MLFQYSRAEQAGAGITFTLTVVFYRHYLYIAMMVITLSNVKSPATNGLPCGKYPACYNMPHRLFLLYHYSIPFLN